jgi:ArsR family transcriptional regulator, arsenate/arsenite/antimonite-responsive transcriptional repressor
MSVDMTSTAPQGARSGCCLPRRIPASDRAQAEAVADMARLLADPIRVQVLELLRSVDGEVCQCELQPLFDVSQPTLSHHLRKLEDAEVIRVQRRGRWAYYSIHEDALEVLRTWLS